MLNTLFAVDETRRPFIRPRHPSEGAVYGAALNHRPLVERLGSSLEDAPYKGRPKAPILYIKPQNTLSGGGAVVALPAPMKGLDTDRFEIGATVAVVIGRTVTAVGEAAAAEAITGYTLAADLSLPHVGYYRPAIREKCLDGSMPLGPDLTAPSALGDVATLTVTTSVDGEAVHTWALVDLIRPVSRLIADISEFMTLNAGDILLVGVADDAPRVGAGHEVTVSAPGLTPLTFAITAGANGAVK